MLDPDDETTYTRKLHAFRLSQKEDAVLAQLAEKIGSESNAIRQGLKALAQSFGIEIDEGLFAPRKEGNRSNNRVGKENRQQNDLTALAV